MNMRNNDTKLQADATARAYPENTQHPAYKPQPSHHLHLIASFGADQA